jgi:hypothetical protein
MQAKKSQSPEFIRTLHSCFVFSTYKHHHRVATTRDLRTMKRDARLRSASMIRGLCNKKKVIPPSESIRTLQSIVVSSTYKHYHRASEISGSYDATRHTQSHRHSKSRTNTINEYTCLFFTHQLYVIHDDLANWLLSLSVSMRITKMVVYVWPLLVYYLTPPFPSQSPTRQSLTDRCSFLPLSYPTC